MSQAKAEWENANLMPHSKERDEAIQKWCNDWLEDLFQELEEKDEEIDYLSEQINEQEDDREPSDIHNELVEICDELDGPVNDKKLCAIEERLRKLASELT